MKRLIGRPPGSFALCESEATAIVLSVRQQQQQMFSVATATKRPARTEINSTL
ncbi:hypothetical protein [Lysinibacillus sp. G4S2]|uniref:hypothetical protein n=1 Tax=Lysinibacillus sp. G4S2 TaxID=3055859 RepID=UPI0025A1F731|nr:hypothetical protein [Lysinibacillus sp. G4S2]MDM5250774.1 hypothetical protein [Lysinibacillus sp. G4S2]